MRVVSAVDDAEVFRFDEIASNTQIGIEVLPEDPYPVLLRPNSIPE